MSVLQVYKSKNMLVNNVPMCRNSQKWPLNVTLLSTFSSVFEASASRTQQQLFKDKMWSDFYTCDLVVSTFQQQHLPPCPQVTQQRRITLQWAALLRQYPPTWQRCQRVSNCWLHSWMMKEEMGSIFWVLPRTWLVLSLTCWRLPSLQIQRYATKVNRILILLHHFVIFFLSCPSSNLFTFLCAWYLCVSASSKPAAGCRKCWPCQWRALVTHRRNRYWSSVPGVSN